MEIKTYIYCPTCNGTGRSLALGQPCPHCLGRGMVEYNGLGSIIEYIAGAKIDAGQPVFIDSDGKVYPAT